MTPFRHHHSFGATTNFTSSSSVVRSFDDFYLRSGLATNAILLCLHFAKKKHWFAWSANHWSSYREDTMKLIAKSSVTELNWVRDQTWRMRRCRLRYGGGHLVVVFGSPLKLVRKAVVASWLTGCCWWWVSSHISLLPLLQLTAPTLHQQLVFAHPDNYRQKKNYQFIFYAQIRNPVCVSVIVGCFIYLV